MRKDTTLHLVMPQTGTRDVQRTLQALLELSGFGSNLPNESIKRMMVVIRKAPDPETACQVITEEFDASGALERKWRKVISETWLDQHPCACSSLELPLTSEEVVDAPALRDARGLLNELDKEPALLVKEHDGWSIADSELLRLTQAMPSLRREEANIAEHEWGHVSLRRLRAVLQTLRLARVHRGRLAVVQCRYEHFLQLPLPQQFYVLWHADAYHVDWGMFGAAWQSYIRTMQNYLPLVWETGEGAIEGEMHRAYELTGILMEVFATLWEQDTTLLSATNQALMRVYEQSALPTVVDRVIIHDLFMRYGLLQPEQSLFDIFQGEQGRSNKSSAYMRWTRIGEVLMAAEREDDLPCSLDIVVSH